MEPFTYEEYRSLLAEFKQHQYEFARFNEISNDFDRPFVLLRHGIDMSREAALRMAEIDVEVGDILGHLRQPRKTWENLPD